MILQPCDCIDSAIQCGLPAFFIPMLHGKIVKANRRPELKKQIQQCLSLPNTTALPSILQIRFK